MRLKLGTTFSNREVGVGRKRAKIWNVPGCQARDTTELHFTHTASATVRSGTPSPYSKELKHQPQVTRAIHPGWP